MKRSRTIFGFCGDLNAESHLQKQQWRNEPKLLSLARQISMSISFSFALASHMCRYRDCHKRPFGYNKHRGLDTPVGSVTLTQCADAGELEAQKRKLDSTRDLSPIDVTRADGSFVERISYGAFQLDSSSIWWWWSGKIDARSFIFTTEFKISKWPTEQKLRLNSRNAKNENSHGLDTETFVHFRGRIKKCFFPDRWVLNALVSIQTQLELRYVQWELAKILKATRDVFIIH